MQSWRGEGELTTAGEAPHQPSRGERFMTCRYWVRSGQRTEPQGSAGGGERPGLPHANLACRGRKKHPLPRRRAAQGEAVPMIQVRGRGVGGGAVLALPSRRPLRSSPHLSGRCGFYVAAAARTYRGGGEENQGGGLRSGVLAATLRELPSLSPVEPRAPLGFGALRGSSRLSLLR